MGAYAPFDIMKYIIIISLFITCLMAQIPGNVRITGRDQDGNRVFQSFDEHGHPIGVTAVLHNIHQGNVYTISKTWLSVADDSSAMLRVKSNGSQLHFEIYTATEGKAYLMTYAGTTYSDTGTVYTPFNRLIGSTNTSSAIITYDPTVSNLGSLRGDDLLGATGATKAGGSTSQIESVLMPNKEFLLRVQNKSGQAKDINIIINYIEEQ